MARTGLEIVGAAGSDTEALLRGVASGRWTLRQPPGPLNPLGRVKFLLPNAHAVFLHDTPAKSAFQGSRRDLSHGCIRLSDPAELAGFVLRNQAGWTPARVAQAMSSWETVRVRVQPGIPVHVVYLTATADMQGDLHFFDDVYGHDASMRGAWTRSRRRVRIILRASRGRPMPA